MFSYDFMCKIKKIEIKGFRGIKDLKLDDLHQVNVLLGNNNSGKSSTLEALMIMMGASKPLLALEMNVNRDYNNIRKEDIQLFFYNCLSDTPININGYFDGGVSRQLSISYFETEEKSVPVSDFGSSEIKSAPSQFGLRYEYNDNQKEYNSTLSVHTNKISEYSTEKEMSHRKAAFVAPRYNFNDFIKNFNKIVTDKEKANVLDVLRFVEPRIKDVTVVGDKVMVDVGLDKLIPINVLGDGTRKMFTLVTAMYSVKGGVLIIDEVDNGLYYKTMSVLWSALLTAAKVLDVQLFVSTHSLDSLNALNRVLMEDECVDMQKEVELMTLRREDDDTITSYRYDYEKFNYVLNMEVEIR